MTAMPDVAFAFSRDNEHSGHTGNRKSRWQAGCPRRSLRTSRAVPCREYCVLGPKCARFPGWERDNPMDILTEALAVAALVAVWLALRTMSSR